ncbi:MAG: RNA polymerase sigma factor [Candidatus Kapaibacteriales bacterium]
MENNFENLEDEALFSKLSVNDKSESEKAFLELYNRYASRVYAYCNRILDNKEDARDMFQETFIRFYQSAKVDRAMTNVPGFLLRIARNLCLNLKRTRRQNFTLEDYMNFEEYSKLKEKDELLELIKVALTGLNDDLREAFILREYEGMSYSEISEFLGISVALVKVRIFRAKQKIREILAPYIAELAKF